MIKIPLQAIPNQRFNVILNDQNCIIHIYQKGEYMYMDFTVNGESVRTGAICLVNISLVAIPTPLFSGTLFFVDLANKGAAPNYKELNDRFILIYAKDGEL